jgi:hypothetical protein
MDICDTYSLISVWNEDFQKTAIRTCSGLFKPLLMSFGLTYALATFLQYVNKTLYQHLDVFRTAYLDDVLIYRETIEEHI